MLFAIDIGNSHTVSGIFDRGRLVANWRLQSSQDRTADELAIRYHALFQMHGILPSQITGCIIASVVPPLETSWLDFTRKNFLELAAPPIAVSHTMNLSIKVATENPAEVGADRIVNAVAAWDRFKTALIVIDFGTAITFDCVSAEQEYLGGTIHPGIGISLDALSQRTAKLPLVKIDTPPEAIIGSTTTKAIHSGMLHGFGGLVDRMVSVLGKELVPGNAKINTIATGGMASIIQPYSEAIETIDPQLTLIGLQLIHNQLNAT